MIMNEAQMVELVQLIQKDPDKAAQMLATSGLTPDQVLSVGAPSMGQIMAPASEAGISSQPPRHMAFMQPGSATPGSPTPMNSFTPPAPGEVPMPQPVVSRDLDQEAAAAMQGVPMQTYQWNQQLPIEQAGMGGAQMPTADMAQVAAGPNQLGMLMSGLKGLSTQSSDQKPIFGANAPAPRDLTSGATKMQSAASMDALLKLLMAGPQTAGPRIPSIGALMGRG